MSERIRGSYDDALYKSAYTLLLRRCVYIASAGARAVRQLLSPIHQLSQRQDADRPRHRGPRQHGADADHQVVDARCGPLFHSRSCTYVHDNSSLLLPVTRLTRQKFRFAERNADIFPWIISLADFREPAVRTGLMNQWIFHVFTILGRLLRVDL